MQFNSSNSASGGGSSTMVIEMPSRSQSPPRSAKDEPRHTTTTTDDMTTGALPLPSTSGPIQRKWNAPRINLYRVLATFYSFMILGGNDAAYGALIPYLESWYSIDYTTVSLVFLSPIIGYTASGLSNNKIHVVFGQRGVAIIMSLSHLIAYAIISVHPPYPALVIVFILAGFGNGLGDSGWNAWIGDFERANEVLGFLHGFYGLGAAVAPFVATTVITKAGWRWYEFYYLMTGAAAIEVVVLVAAFWKADARAYHNDHPQTAEIDLSGTSTPTGLLHAEASTQDGSRAKTSSSSKSGFFAKLNPFANKNSLTTQALKNKATIVVSLYLLIYVGAEVSIGGWVVTFMLRVRGASPFASGLTPTGFWLGITIGRFILGFVTGRFFKSEKHAVATYLVASIVLQLLFWLIPQFLVSAVMVSLLGFFLGPLFPCAVVVLTRLLPPRLHVPSIGLAAAFGASGACVLPFLTGAIANSVGVKTLQPVVLAALVGCLAVWMLVPKLPKQRMA